MLTGLFVNHDNPIEVDMLRLVESPPGHLRGSLVVSFFNADGSRKKDAVYDVTGTITRPNVSLQLEGGLVGLAEFFGASTNLVGSLRGGTLTLSWETRRRLSTKPRRSNTTPCSRVWMRPGTTLHWFGKPSEQYRKLRRTINSSMPT
jgi:hypothetical protein